MKKAINLMRFIIKAGFVLGLLFIFSGCKTTSTGNIEASSDEGMGLSWGITFSKKPDNVPSIEEMIKGADLIARAEVVSNRPVNFKHKGVSYYQLCLLDIEEVIKGRMPSEVITVYARESNLPPKAISAYELCDELLVFLYKDSGYYFTYKGAYGQMPISGERITNWRKMDDGQYVEDVIIPYSEAKELIIINLYVNNLNQEGLNEGQR
jgi:hypothetical protein